MGKLPVTVYDESFEDVFDMLDFDMTKAPGRTYRYYTGVPLWEFGFGLSYTTFTLDILASGALLLKQQGTGATLKVEVKNIGNVDGDEVVMAFFTPKPGTLPVGSRAAALRKQLFGFRRVSLGVNGSSIVEFPLSAKSLEVSDDAGNLVSYAGAYLITISNGIMDAHIDVEVDGTGLPQPMVY